MIHLPSFLDILRMASSNLKIVTKMKIGITTMLTEAHETGSGDVNDLPYNFILLLISKREYVINSLGNHKQDNIISNVLSSIKTTW